MSRIRLLSGVCLLALLSSFGDQQAIVKLSSNSARIAALLPRVAAIPFESCVERRMYAQFAENQRAWPDRSAAIAFCQPDADTRDRLVKEFSVLTTYLTVLANLANADRASASKSVEHIATAAGANAQAAGLMGALQKAVLDRHTAHALRNAVAEADPHVQALCSGFRSRILPILQTALANQQLEMGAFYSDGASAAPGNRVLLFGQFQAESERIRQSGATAAAYARALEDLAHAHAHLLAHRDHLGSRETLAELSADNAKLEQDLNAVEAGRP